MKQKEITQYECYTCFCFWVEEHLIGKEPDHVKCSYCRDHGNYTDLDLLKRRIEVMSISSPARFPVVMQQLLEHVVLKE